jgi:hypothetical protein
MLRPCKAALAEDRDASSTFASRSQTWVTSSGGSRGSISHRSVPASAHTQVTTCCQSTSGFHADVRGRSRSHRKTPGRGAHTRVVVGIDVDRRGIPYDRAVYDAGVERHPRREIAPASHRPRQREIGQIGAGDEQHEPGAHPQGAIDHQGIRADVGLRIGPHRSREAPIRDRIGADRRRLMISSSARAAGRVASSRSRPNTLPARSGVRAKGIQRSCSYPWTKLSGTTPTTVTAASLI